MIWALRRCGPAAAVAALLMTAAAAAPIDTMETQDMHADRPHNQVEIAASVGSLTSGDAGGAAAHNTLQEETEQFDPVPPFARIEIGDNPGEVDAVVAVGDVTGMDNRDPQSSYVFATSDLYGAAVCALQPYDRFGRGRFLIQVAQNPMSGSGVGQGWYLGVDRAKPEDTLNGQLRIILHADQSKAAAWKWTQNPYGDGKVLHLAAMACKGCYLARSSSRTDNSYYLVASHDPGEALNVNVQPAAGYEEVHVTPE